MLRLPKPQTYRKFEPYATKLTWSTGLRNFHLLLLKNIHIYREYDREINEKTNKHNRYKLMPIEQAGLDNLTG